MTTTDLAVIENEAVSEDALPEPLKAADAKKLDKKVRTARDRVTTDMESLKALVDEAALGQIHVGLGLRSWTEWAKDALHFSFSFDQRLERKATAQMLAEKGMSQHAIADMLGVTQKTISRDLAGTEFEGPITATDGREMPRHTATQGAEGDSDNDDENVIDGEIVDPDPEPDVQGDRTSVNEDFQNEIYQLQNDIEALREVIADERFTKQRKRIAAKHLNTLQEIKAALEDIIDNVFGE